MRALLCQRRAVPLRADDLAAVASASDADVESLASQDRTIIEYPEAHHTLEFEPDPSRYARDLIEWIERTTANRSEAERVASSGDKPH